MAQVKSDKGIMVYRTVFACWDVFEIGIKKAAIHFDPFKLAITSLIW